MIITSVPLTVPDDFLGFRANPAWRSAAMVLDQVGGGRSERLDVVNTLDQEGYRVVTSTDVAADAEECWLFGCSYFFGWFVNDDEVVSTILQQKMPNLRIRNFASCGYSAAQNLLNLKLRVRGSTPKAVVFSFLRDHMRRTACAPDWLRDVLKSRDARWDANRKLWQPRPVMDIAGAIRGYLRVPLHDEGIAKIDSTIGHYDEFQLWKLTEAVLAAACLECQKRGIDFVLALLEPVGDQTVVDMARDLVIGLGGRCVDARFPVQTRTSDWYLLPFDKHPNGRAHAFWAEALARELSRLA